MLVDTDYHPRHRDALLRLVARESYPEALWLWQFESNPRGIPFRPVMLSDAETGEPMAFNGVMAIRAIVRGVERDACWSCDFHVARSLRGTGLGRRVKELLHERSPLLLTFGVSPVAAIVLKKMGWHPNRTVITYRKSSSGRRPIDRLRGWLQLGARTGARVRLHRRGRVASSPGVRVVVSQTLAERARVDALWRTVAGSYRNIVVRDHAYLNWRYQNCPVGQYRFVEVSDGADLRAIGIIRNEQGTTRLVDLLAHADDALARREIVAAWLSMDELADVALAPTSDRLLGDVLLHAGFIRGRERPGFFVRVAGDDETAANDWFIMAGDSDGEFLQAARDQMDRAKTRGRLVVRRLLEPEWSEHPDVWDGLLERSSSDRLFLSLAWQSNWWKQWQAALGLEGCVLGVYRDDLLVGLAPLYRRPKRLPSGLRVIELHVMGNAWGVAPTVRTEYLSTIVDRSYTDEVAQALAHALDRMRWDRMVVRDHVCGAQPEPWFKVQGATSIRRNLDEGVVIDTTGSFRTWLLELGRHTRLKVYNRRRYLEGLGRPVEFLALDDPAAALKLLNDFHRVRWGRPVFAGPSLRFHLQLLEQLPTHARRRLSALRIEGEIRSVLYDIQVDDRVYNLQAGFEEGYDAKVSLGTLHLGFALEQAFKNPSVTSYDLLAGSGKQEFYKYHFRGQRVQFETYQIVRHPLLRLPLIAYQALKPRADPPAAWSLRRHPPMASASPVEKRDSRFTKMKERA